MTPNWFWLSVPRIYMKVREKTSSKNKLCCPSVYINIKICCCSLAWYRLFCVYFCLIWWQGLPPSQTHRDPVPDYLVTVIIRWPYAYHSKTACKSIQYFYSMIITLCQRDYKYNMFFFSKAKLFVLNLLISVFEYLVLLTISKFCYSINTTDMKKEKRRSA